MQLHSVKSFYTPLLFLALMVGACSPDLLSPTESIPTSPAAEEPSELIYAIGFEPSIIDPHRAGSFDAHLMFMQVYDPLLWLGPDGELYPGLAEEWEVSDDAQVFTFHLRQEAVFHDGTPFTAAAVKFAFDRIMDPERVSLTARDLLGPYSHTEVVDDYTVRVHFDQPYAPFLDAVTHHNLAPVSPAAVAQRGEEEYAYHQVGTGPFIWQEYQRGQHVRLVRNPDYAWAPAFFDHEGLPCQDRQAYGDQGPPRPNSVVFRFAPEPSTRAGLLESAQVHIAQDLTPVEVVRLRPESGLELHSVSVPGLPVSLLVNTAHPPTDDVRVRRALLHSLDREALVATMFQNLTEPVYGPLAPGSFAYRADLQDRYPFDPEAAAQLLDDAGWLPGIDGVRTRNGQRLTLELNTMPFNRYPEILQMVEAQFEAVGFEVNLNVMPTWSQFSSAGQAGEHHLMTYFMPAYDPHFALWPFFDSTQVGGGLNFSRLHDSEIDRLLAAGQASTNVEERKQIYQEVQGLLMENAALIPLYVFTHNTMSQATVQDLRFDRRGWHPWLAEVYLDR